MPYAVVPNARNTLVPRFVVRKRIVQRRRGFGQFDDPGFLNDIGSSLNDTTDVGYIPGATTGVPGATVENPTGTVITGSETYVPGSTLPTGEQVSGTVGTIGSSAGCAAGYVVGDSAGNCVPANTLAQTLANPAAAAALGLTPAQAASIATAVTAIAKAATGQTSIPASAVVPVSTNPFSNISPTVWVIGAVAFVGLLLISKKR